MVPITNNSSLMRIFSKRTLKAILMADLKIVLIIFLAQRVSAVELGCIFEVRVGGYDCKMTSNLKLNNQTITSTNGIHKGDRNDSNVEVLLVQGGTTNYLPVASCAYFTAMKKFEVYANKLVDISRDIFHNCTNVKEVKIAYNLITKLPEDVFYDLPNLLSLKMNKNRIEVLPTNLFTQNPKLVEIILDNNRIASIQANLPVAARFVNLRANICIDESYPDGLKRMNLLLYEVLMKCKIPPLEKENLELQLIMNKLERDIANDTEVIGEFEDEKLEVTRNASKNCYFKIQTKESEIKDLRSNLSKVESDYVAIKLTYNSCQASVTSMNISQSELSKEIELLTSNHSIAQDNVNELFAEIVDLKQKLSEMKSQFFEKTALLALCTSEKLNANETLQLLITNLSALVTQNEARRIKIADLESDIGRVKSEYNVTVEELNAELLKALDNNVLCESRNEELSVKMFELESNLTDAAENCSYDVHTITREAEALRADSSTISSKVLIVLMLVGWIATIIYFLKSRRHRLSYADRLDMKALSSE